MPQKPAFLFDRRIYFQRDRAPLFKNHEKKRVDRVPFSKVKCCYNQVLEMISICRKIVGPIFPKVTNNIQQEYIHASIASFHFKIFSFLNDWLRFIPISSLLNFISTVIYFSVSLLTWKNMSYLNPKTELAVFSDVEET